MKNVILASVIVLILILVCITSLTIYSHNSRQNEVEEALTVAVEQALENLKINKQYPIENDDELVADFVQRLVMGIDSDSDIEVKILAIDREKGLLDVEVVETYRQLNGSTGKASYRKTVIFEEVYKTPEQYFSIDFMMEESYESGSFKTYKSYTLLEGQKVKFPGANPTMEGKTFVGWSDTKPSAENDYAPEVIPADKEIVLSEDLTFYAVFG